MQLMVIAILIGLWISSFKLKVDEKNKYGKINTPFYRISCVLYQMNYKILKKTAYYRKLEDRLHILYPNEERSHIVRQFVCYKVMFVIMILFCGSLISLGFKIQEKDSAEKIQSLKRDTYWGDERYEELRVSIDGVMEEEPFQFRIKEQSYPKEEIQALLQKKAKQLEQLILKQNKTVDYVTTDLNLIKKIPSTDIEVIWEINKEEVVGYDGKLCREALGKDGTLVLLTATLSYKRQSFIYSFYVNVYQEKLSPKENLKNELLKEVEKRNEESNTKAVVELPTQIEGKTILFFKSVERYAGKIIIIAAICAILIFFVQDEKLNKQLSNRKSQLLIDYPELVSKLTLLLGAGMTIRGALEKMAEDYVISQKRSKYKQRYLYDEILLVCREMQSGVSEKSAIEKLGKRYQLPCYMRFSTILQQNLKKGSEGLAELLGNEVSEAFQKRKNIARKAGEEAGTKLLGPMLFMLIIVLVILILPAFMSFQM